MTGSGPGVGKSTVATGLATWLEACGSDVELFREEEILSRAEWSDVVRGVTAGERVKPATLLKAAEDYLDWASTTRRASVYVLDALFPHLPSLFAWGYDDAEVREFLAAFGALTAGDAVLELHVSGNAVEGVERAVGREGPEWLPGLARRIAEFADATNPMQTVLDVARYFERNEHRTLGLLEAAPWTVVVLNADAGQVELERQARVRFTELAGPDSMKTAIDSGSPPLPGGDDPSGPRGG